MIAACLKTMMAAGLAALLVIAPAIAADADAASTASPVAPPAASAAASAPRQVLVLLDMPAPHFRPDGNYAGGYVDAAARSARRRMANALAKAHGLRLANDWPMPVLGVDCYVMDVPQNASIQTVSEQLSKEPQVAWAQPMNVFRSYGAHDDPLFGMQPAARDWQLAALHDVATGRGVHVALIDSGVQRDHPDLAGQIAASANYVVDKPEQAELHGTADAGIIAARADNHIGIAGVAPHVQLHALRACWQQSATDTLCTSLTLALALHAAVESGAQVINLSLGGPPDKLLQRLIEAAQTRGAFVVAAVDRSQVQGGFPARLPGVIAVSDEATAIAAAMLAPGTDVPTTVPGSRWATVSGSSYSAAHVSGLVALMIEARAGAARAGHPPRSAISPASFVLHADRSIDACATLARAAELCVCDCEQAAAIGSVAPH